MSEAKAAPLKRVTLTLARSKEFPMGSTRYGYEIIVPLDGNDRIDVATWKQKRADCTVRHFAAGQPDLSGMLVHKPGGREHVQWVFDYDRSRADDDEAGFLFGSHHFRPGEYVSVRGPDGKLTTFAVAAIESVA
ncbi:MAG: hypothetical protein JOZ70_15295 [Pseudolabrys sp.]|nr:hypothetical protein [Pseudolabrys sp.]MBV9956603.1 hypothetical protein [Pseudolabrys sp.]